MADTEARFMHAVHHIATGTGPKPSQAVQLQFYGLYKQATQGDNLNARPWAVQLVAVAKWNAWSACKGLDSATAQAQYTALLTRRNPGWS